MNIIVTDCPDTEKQKLLEDIIKMMKFLKKDNVVVNTCFNPHKKEEYYFILDINGESYYISYNESYHNGDQYGWSKEEMEIPYEDLKCAKFELFDQCAAKIKKQEEKESELKFLRKVSDKIGIDYSLVK